MDVLLQQLAAPSTLTGAALTALSAALSDSAGGDREVLLRAALARKAQLDETAAARALEAALLDHIATSHAALARIASALQCHFHEGLSDSRLLGAVHVALEVDALSPRELFLLLQPLLASDERFSRLLPAHAPLLDRLRAANVCRGVALATGPVGALDAVVGFEHAERFLGALAALYDDPDPTVGARAAWAMGALYDDPRVARISQRAAGPRAGVLGRRALVVDVARWQLGELADDAFLGQLRGGLGKTDPYARASAILAMTYGVAVAPETTLDVVSSFALDPSPLVRTAVGAFAGALPVEASAPLLASLRSAPGDAPAALRIWLDDGGPERPLGALRDARRAARRGARAPRPHVQQALALLSRGAPDEDVLDAALFASPLLHDVATALGDAELTGAGRACLSGAWGRRVSAQLRGADDSADRVRGLRRVLDAYPSGPAEHPDEHLALVRALFTRLSTSRGELSRPVASALVASLEPLFVGERMAPGELLTAALTIESARALGALASALTGPAASAVEALAALRASLDKARGKAPVDGAALVAQVDALADAVSTLGPAGGPLEVASLALRAAVHATAGRSTTALQCWREAYVSVEAALAGVAPPGAARFELASRSALTDEEVVHLLRSVLVAQKLATPDPGRALTSAAKASRRWNAAAPAALSGLLSGLLAAEPLAKAAAPAPHGPVYEGKRIGDYVVVRVLGSGAMGHCVLVQRRLEAKNVPSRARCWVLKLPQRPDLVGLFREEALALIRLSEERHPGIVRFVSFVDYGTRLPFLVMDFVAGESLEHRLHRGPLAHAEIVAIAARLASALETSHARGISHYDLKPANVVLGVDGPVIVDWGLAGAAMPNAGTPEYMAPERFALEHAPSAEVQTAQTVPFAEERAQAAASDRGLSGSADVFALGCIVAELVSGAPLVTPTLTAEDTKEHPLLGQALDHLGDAFRRAYGCAAVVRNAVILRRRADLALAAAHPVLAELALACLAHEPAARPSAASLARRLAELALIAPTRGGP
mgnify:CR=1 FL=1